MKVAKRLGIETLKGAKSPGGELAKYSEAPMIRI